MNAKIAVCKCPSNMRIFGIRLEEREGDWVRTWAFKIDEEKSKREGFDETILTGTLNPVDEYPGCPYCGAMPFAQCSCGKIFCAKDWTGKTMNLTCPWCGQTALYTPVDKTHIKGGGL
jgi:DNA-directed RNA polymerase subunit RPC12/RpoP